MLFNKKIEPSCSYCARGTRLNDTEVACLRCGIVSAGGSCRHFKYDPLRREPAHPVLLDTGKFSDEDFSLD